ncbi:MAG: tetratricopeptide repeat protein [Nitrospirae bacterium]|nr:tetratricopeptide repeat protein [Nitrospirota bacterium]
MVCLLFYVFATPVSAGNVTFIKEYTYQASELDSKVSSRAIALEQVKRLLLEELGVYLITETEVKDFQLTKDQITILSAGIVSAEVIDEKWDGVTYYLKAKISADPSEVAKSINALKEDRQKSKELEESKRKAEQALREIEKLKKEISELKDKTKKQEEYTVSVKKLSATDYFDKGYALAESGNYKEAISAYSKAIELNPELTDAYNNRGIAYKNLGDYQRAINEYNKAIELNPEFAEAYYNRGPAYNRLGDYQRAIADLKTSARLGFKPAQDFLRSQGIDW